MNTDNIALMYLAEQTSPESYNISNLNVVDKVGCVYAEFEACLHSFDVINRNARMYDLENIKQCVETSDMIQDNLRKNGWYGEMDHPTQEYENSPLSSQRIMSINMKNRSHKIMNPTFKNNCLYATIQTASGTDAGVGMCREIVQGLVPSFSCRSIAAMKARNGKPYVHVKNLRTYDWVLYPSHKEAEMVSKPEVSDGLKKKVVLESVNDYAFKPFQQGFSRDVCVDMNQFKDFNHLLKEHDGNVNMVLEAFDYSSNDIVGFDRGLNAVIQKRGNTIYVNTNPDTKKKVEDFLSSF